MEREQGQPLLPFAAKFLQIGVDGPVYQDQARPRFATLPRSMFFSVPVSTV